MTLRKVIDQKNIVLVKESLFFPLLGYVYRMYVDNLFLVLVVSFDGGDGWDENDDEDFDEVVEIRSTENLELSRSIRIQHGFRLEYPCYHYSNDLLLFPCVGERNDDGQITQLDFK